MDNTSPETSIGLSLHEDVAASEDDVLSSDESVRPLLCVLLSPSSFSGPASCPACKPGTTLVCSCDDPALVLFTRRPLNRHCLRMFTFMHDVHAENIVPNALGGFTKLPLSHKALEGYPCTSLVVTVVLQEHMWHRLPSCPGWGMQVSPDGGAAAAKFCPNLYTFWPSACTCQTHPYQRLSISSACRC